jgi:hypothetical protein
MKGHSDDRRWGFWLADHGLAMGGLALLAVGAATSWWALSLGSAALAIAFFAWVAEADGFAVPRPGRVAIRRGGFDIPLAFKVRLGKRVLLFVCEEDPERGGWSDVYTVLGQPRGTDGSDGFEPLYSLPPATPPSGWSLRGRVPIDKLRFEHHERVVYVTRGSLERSLSAAGM